LGRPRVSREPNSVHMWLKRNYPKSGACEQCNSEGETDYAFLRHPETYTWDISDYAELCRSCHAKLDNREPLTAKVNREKTHCVNGHLLEGENVYERLTGGRACKTCHRESNKLYARRKRLTK
jgi:hypothetical protein